MIKHLKRKYYQWLLVEIRETMEIEFENQNTARTDEFMIQLNCQMIGVMDILMFGLVLV